MSAARATEKAKTDVRKFVSQLRIKDGKGAAKKKVPVKEKADVRVMANFTQSMYDRLRAKVREREDVWERGTPRPTLSLLIREAVDKMLSE